MNYSDNKLQKELVEWRRKLHQIPERGMKLPQTMAFICNELDKMGVAYQLHEDISCIAATIGSGGKCFLLRGDVDALPLTEEADVPFKSTNGYMHACGHDLHGAMLLGAAKLLKDHEKELNGTVKLLFQSGEEIFEGARAAIDAGVLENPSVDAGFAMHVKSTMPVGVVQTGKEAMAAVDGFRITLTGKGGHGSAPAACIDPINAAVQVYLALQSLIARETAGFEEAVLTIGQLSAGDAPNVIPKQAVMQGTLRTFNPNVRKRLAARIQEVVSGVAQTYRCQYQYEILSECAGLVTDDAVTAAATQSILKVAPHMHIRTDGHGMGSEDFAEFALRVPCAHFVLGAAPEQTDKRFGLHDPRVVFNEDALGLGAAIYAQAAMDWLNEN